MEFTALKTVSNISTNVVEKRTYRLLQELNFIEASDITNPNEVDNISSERDEQTGAVTGEVILRCTAALQDGNPHFILLNPYQTSDNYIEAFYESAMTQLLAEQSQLNNSTNTKYISLASTFIPREEIGTGSYNYTITFSFTDLPTVRNFVGAGIQIEAATYLQNG